MIKLLEPIGFGTSAEIWRAEMDIHPLVAVKLSLQHFDDAGVRRELYLYQHLVHLASSNIVRIHCLLEFEQRFGIIMELADCNLFDKLRQYRKENRLFPVDQLVAYIQGAAAALDYCHSLRFVHGGINPSDILLFGENAKIADFGLSHHLNTQGVIIKAKSLVKEYCMSPEAKEGKALPQSDQYALAASYAWLRLGHPISNLSSHEKDLSSLPDGERQILLKGLAANPEHRYPSCVALCEALATVVGKTKGDIQGSA
ncbi:MAG TPA: protein kinase [Ktedonobacteraceae bacterium]|nr:protein kinase [Ktedonobacteraceae bacterium]